IRAGLRQRRAKSASDAAGADYCNPHPILLVNLFPRVEVRRHLPIFDQPPWHDREHAAVQSPLTEADIARLLRKGNVYAGLTAPEQALLMAGHGHIKAAGPDQMADGGRALDAVATRLPARDLRAAGRARHPALARWRIRADAAPGCIRPQFHLAFGRR